MNIHEFQAKKLLKKYGVPVPDNEVACSAEEAGELAKKIGRNHWVIKAQVHSGGRGKAGGVLFASTIDEVKSATRDLIGTRLVTVQTDEYGQPINKVLIEASSDIDQELYLGVLIDRTSQSVVFVASTEGGIEIEEVAKKSPEKILKLFVNPTIGLQPHQCRNLFFNLNLDIVLLNSFTKMMIDLYRLFVSCDFTLLEVNPLVVTKSQELLCLDAKINIDDNALYRQPEIRTMRDPSQEDKIENRAQQLELNYISLDGDIGCMVNGAGLAMATMDLIQLHGGRPANFLDVGGGTTEERVAEAFKIIISHKNVKGILVNIFGGIVRCDLIADGIITAVSDIGLKLPTIVRLEGNNADLGAKILSENNLNIIAENSLLNAAKRIVKIVNKG